MALLTPTIALVSQQLLAIQEELNNKKSELEQAKEEQSHTQALLKVLQEQVSEKESALISEFRHCRLTQARASHTQPGLKEACRRLTLHPLPAPSNSAMWDL